ncbi:hypothetical protein F5Y04DRAFT_97604 [Hypomontagnella monticulosa]|nr:hypothetical protein F5Y04DRAFT_97604 [Hypomontagnella monticulosa]
MPRKLPWKRQDDGSSTPIRKSAASTPVRQNVKRDESDGDGDGVQRLPASAISVKRVKRSASPPPKRLPRPGSTSPPPEPLSESYMVEGLEHDDMFRMVEDEFLATAQLFTAHLHAAEYHRLKAASKSENASTIKDISRPVVGPMTDIVQHKQNRKSLIKKQRAATRKAMAANKGQSDDETESDDSQQSISLYGLMKSPRKQAARLDNLTKAVTTTRAAAGFGTTTSRSAITTPRLTTSGLPGSKLTAKTTLKEASETEDDEDDDNLDTPPVRIRANVNGKLPVSTPQPPKPRQVPIIAKSSPSLRYLEKATTPPISRVASRATKKSGTHDDSGEDLLSKLKKRQEERQRNREQRRLAASKAQSKEAANDIIPGFL